MTTDVLEQASFHLTGETLGGGLEDVGELNLRPALLAGYASLSRLRYDYPLIMVDGDAGGGAVQSLSSVIDGILREISSPGIEGERLRCDVLKLETAICRLVSRGADGSLAQLWDLARKNLLSKAAADDAKALEDSLSRARCALRFDGDVVDCDDEAPGALLAHLWSAVEKAKALSALGRLDRLALKLSDILKADFMRSSEGRAPETLERSVGPADALAFDFEVMSTMLAMASPNGAMPKTRRRRIRAALSALESQKFFGRANGHADAKRGNGVHDFAFENCAQALKSFHDRLPEMAGLVKAISIAELEIENLYRESKHDPFFDRFDESSLAHNDLEMFPSYLVRLRSGHCSAAEKAKLFDALSSGLPIKVLLQSDDILEELSIATGQFSFGAKGQQPSTMALGLNSAYVMQASGSCLYQMRERVARGMAYHGPALFSIFSGAVRKGTRSVRNVPGLPPYLRAAAAMESRAFPAFTYDPGAGPDWASRFRIIENPQAAADWPVHRFCYEDDDLQRVADEVAFTFVDFVACDKRYAGRFARVPRCKWHDGMVPVNEFLEHDAADAPDGVPYILMVDERDMLHRVIVEDRLIAAARRCRETWRGLQELGGIDNSHVRAALDREREIWQADKAREIEALRKEAPREADAPRTEATSDTPTDVVAEAAEEIEEAPSDEPYIETPRCTTCNECTELNNKLFAYDENMQAYIADIGGGTYRELVEAAEICQVAIIHPGKPVNPGEPNLAALVERAEEFN